MYKLIKDSINLLNNDINQQGLIDLLGISCYLQEFRTISLNVPRQVGKTTSLYKLHTEISSVLLTHTNRAHCTFRTKYKHRGTKCLYNGMKLQALLIDEPKMVNKQISNNDTFDILAYMYSHGMLTKDFFILEVGTQ